jgi:hypothetical protein
MRRVVRDRGFEERSMEVVVVHPGLQFVGGML